MTEEFGINPIIQALQEENRASEPPVQQPESRPVMKRRTGPAKDIRWLIIWISGIFLIGVWDILFLNKPALKKVVAGLTNTFFISLQVLLYSLILAWITAVALHYLETRKHHIGYLCLSFLLNLTRSVPQVVGILFGCIWITSMCKSSGCSIPYTAFEIIDFPIPDSPKRKVIFFSGKEKSLALTMVLPPDAICTANDFVLIICAFQRNHWKCDRCSGGKTP